MSKNNKNLPIGISQIDLFMSYFVRPTVQNPKILLLFIQISVYYHRYQINPEIVHILGAVIRSFLHLKWLKTINRLYKELLIYFLSID